MKKYLIILTALFFLNACKSLEKTHYDSTRKISRSKLLKELDKHRFSVRSFESKIHMEYTTPDNKVSGNGRIKILKDSVIWGSLNFLGIPVVKFHITPEKIQYYNKLNKTYYDGNFDLVSQYLGVELDFQNLQNLLLGDLLTDIKAGDYRLKRDEKNYRLLAKEPQLLDSIQIAPFFKITHEYLQEQEQSAQVNYLTYQKIKQENLPKIIEIITGNGIKLKLEYKNPSTGKKLRFPFQIPSGYSPVY